VKAFEIKIQFTSLFLRTKVVSNVMPLLPGQGVCIGISEEVLGGVVGLVVHGVQHRVLTGTDHTLVLEKV